ncbi:hypothetical protein HDK64DRAFT_265562 [Phyllosticta capitalensis]
MTARFVGNGGVGAIVCCFFTFSLCAGSGSHANSQNTPWRPGSAPTARSVDKICEPPTPTASLASPSTEKPIGRGVLPGGFRADARLSCS